MSTLDTLLERNHEFATHRFVAGLPMRPSLQTLIIGCADPRVDPVHILGLEPGEAVVLRNVGGRVTPGTLQLLSMLLQVPTGAAKRADRREHQLTLSPHRASAYRLWHHTAGQQYGADGRLFRRPARGASGQSHRGSARRRGQPI